MRLRSKGLSATLYLVWLALILLTGASLWLAEGSELRLGNGELPHTAVSVGVLTLVFVKISVVGNYFMEIRHAVIGLRAIFFAWVLTVWGVLSALFILAS
ncbi:hypothetical protein ABIA39_009019 [Nocardia sp. GAS34]|uniref:cytochrome C oxidase subunit IV family protein n=1 Tax=unclassified Nocardia TaxID=2637762 RepID=UPI003D1C3921